MKKKLIVALFVGMLAGGSFFVGDSLLSYRELRFRDARWWEIATVEDVRKEMKKIDGVVDRGLIDCCLDCFCGGMISSSILDYAVKYSNNPEVIKLLIDMKADDYVYFYKGGLVIAGYDASEPEEGFDKMPGYHGKQEALWLAIEANKSFEIIKLLIEAGADVNVALMRTARNNRNSGAIKLLIDAGADVNARN